MMQRAYAYLMENREEATRLEIKTDPAAVKKQAQWCGIKPGMRIMDAGCGPGKTTSILHKMIQPGGTIVGVDYSENRINYAREYYSHLPGIEFQVHDLRNPLNGLGQFDLIWVRFVLQHDLAESPDIIKNLTACLKPEGYLCLLDLDYNCLNHYELPEKAEDILFQLMDELEKTFNFDAYAGRKLYAYLYDMGYRDIAVELIAHHLFYGEMSQEDKFNWRKKFEVVIVKVKDIFHNYPGGMEAFQTEFFRFFNDPRRFTYTPMILCKGKKPLNN